MSFALGSVSPQDKVQLNKITQQKILRYSTVTHCGVRFDVLKSCLQKAIRRGDQETVMWAVRETILLIKLGDISSVAKGHHTNMLNRLRIISVEDVSPRELFVFSMVHKWIQEYQTSVYEDVAYLARAALILSHARKSRVCSHLRVAACDHRSCRFKEQLEMECRLYNIPLECRLYNIPLEERKTLVFELLRTKEKNVTKARFMAVYHLGMAYRQLLGMGPTDDITSVDSKKDTAAFKKVHFNWFWKEAERLVAMNETKERFECWPSIIKALACTIIWKRKIFISRNYFREEFLVLVSVLESLAAVLLEPLESMKSAAWESFHIIANMKKAKCDNNFKWIVHHKPITHPAYVFDRHTSQGEKSIAFFINHGSLVKNEDTPWTNQEWSDIYKTIRISQDSDSHRVRPKKRPQPEQLPSAKRHKNTSSFFTINQSEVKKIVCNYNPKSTKAAVLLVEMINGNKVVMKEMKKSFGYGIDQNFCLYLKKLNITQLNLNVPEGCDQEGLFRADFVYSKEKNDFIPSEKSIVYFLMGRVNNTDARCSHNLQQTETLLKTSEGFRQLINILIFRMLMGVTDTNFTNVLVHEGKMYSVDENYIGKFSSKEIVESHHVKRIFKIIKAHFNNKPVRKEHLEYLPRWLSCVTDRGVMLEELVRLGREMGVNEKTLEKVSRNAESVYNNLVMALQAE